MLQKRFRQTIKILGLASITFLLFSFLTPRGGEGYEVFLNNKVVTQQFGASIGKGYDLSLEKARPTDILKINYHRCGNSGNNRVFSIRNSQGKVLKEWRFANETERIASMTCQVKEIISLQKEASNQTLQLFYTSTELPKGRLLASLKPTSQKATASLNR